MPSGKGIYLPGLKTKEYRNPEQVAIFVADLLTFFEDYIDKEKCNRFAVTIHLNNKNNKKTYYGIESLEAIDNIIKNNLLDKG